MCLQAKRLLLVEDEPLLLLSLQEGLSELGCSVVAAECRLPGAIESASRLDFDAALLDISIAGESVGPVALALEERGIPFVFATGYETHPVVDAFPAAAHLRKPYLLETVEQALNEVLAQREGL